MNQEHALEPLFALTAEELHSTAWLKIRSHYECELEKLRSKNDGDQPPEATAKLRGRIMEIKKLLALETKD